MIPKQKKVLQNQILSWYAYHQRDLPWRKTQNPYFIWVSEVMLQQTQVDTVIPYYERFISIFPSLNALAAAPLQKVLKAWENLGYYSRARNLHKSANIMVHDMDAAVPASKTDLLRLPGIGPYIAGAILSIAFNQSVPAVDGNVKRVISRIFLIQESLDDKNIKKQIQTLAKELIPKDASARFNQAIMDFGAVICKPQKPECKSCPIPNHCLAYGQGLQDQIPVIQKKKSIPHKEFVAGIIYNKKKQFLLVRRLDSELLGGLWKFPGGKRVNGDKDLMQTLRRTIQEEIGIRVRIGKPLCSVKHAYSHFKITLHAFRCIHRTGKPLALGCQDWRWVDINDLYKMPLSRADRKIMESGLT